MYYHIYIEYFAGDNKKQKKEDCYEKNLVSLDKIKKYYVSPFSENKTFFVSGRVIRPGSINVFRILKSEKSLDQIVTEKNESIPDGVIMWYGCDHILAGDYDDLVDITNEVMNGEM